MDFWLAEGRVSAALVFSAVRRGAVLKVIAFGVLLAGLTPATQTLAQAPNTLLNIPPTLWPVAKPRSGPHDHWRISGTARQWFRRFQL